MRIRNTLSILALLLSLTLVSCDDDDGGGVTCPEEYNVCDGVCVDTNYDPGNCGSCGNACDAGQVCNAGTCELVCGGSTVECNGDCVNTDIDPDNCGSCGNACDPGQVCDAGTCALSCGGDTVECNGGCVNTDIDSANCGSCGNACDTGQVCVSGQCEGDNTPPTITGSTPGDADVAVPGDLALITITFDEVLNPATVDNSTVTVTNDLGTVTGTVNLVSGGTAISFVVDSRVGYMQNVDVTVAGTVEDIAGNAMGSDYTFSFSTAPMGILIEPGSFFGVISDTAVLTLTAYGDSGAQSITADSWSTDVSSVATVSATGFVTLTGNGLAMVTAHYGAISASVPVGCANRIGQPALSMTSAMVVNGETVMWDFNEYGAIEDGGGDRYDDVWELSVDNITTGSSESMPACDATEVTFDEPYDYQESLYAGDAFVISGNYTCYMSGAGGEGHVWQEFTISATALSTNLSFKYRYGLTGRNFQEAGYSVSIEDMTGGTGETLLMGDTDTSNLQSGPAQNGSYNLSPWIGQTVRLHFRFVGGIHPYYEAPFSIDNVSVLDDSGTQYIVNGDCETGDTTGWQKETFLIAREATLAPVDPVADVLVSRSLYAGYEPGSWARYLDSFTNDSTGVVEFTVIYESDLGSDDAGVIYTHVGDRAYLEYDEDGDPGLGVIPGTTSMTDIPSYSEYWTVEYTLTLNPGETKSLLAFHMSDDGNSPAPSLFLQNLSEEIINSVDWLGIGSPYLVGLTLAEYDTISNWP